MSVVVRGLGFALGLYAVQFSAHAAEVLAVTVPRMASSAQLRMVLPDGTVTDRHFDRAADVAAIQPQALIDTEAGDGLYRYEIRFAQTLAPEVKAAALKAREQGSIMAATRMPKVLPPVAGSFRVAAGKVVDSTLTEAGSSSVSSSASVLVPNDQVIPDDLIVQSSLCVGFDCVDGESFGFDTIRMKENNTRIKFEDTSASGFPSDDWQLTANGTNAGDANQFSIDNITQATVPFKIVGAAPSNSLLVDASGHVGLGTSVPTFKLHVFLDNTPGIRFEQATAPWGAQTWDVAGNEANFFVRDVTNGSKLPFRIRPGAPTSSIDIAATGNVGIGTSSPQARLHVEGDAYIAGTLTQLSSRSAKTHLVAVAADNILDQLAELPLWTWNYIRSDEHDRHIGPVAEDFYAAFGFGTSERHLAPSDVAGVALAATQALQREVTARDRTIKALETRLARLEAMLEERSADRDTSSPGH